MSAADESKRQGGAPVSIKEIIKKAETNNFKNESEDKIQKRN